MTTGTAAAVPWHTRAAALLAVASQVAGVKGGQRVVGQIGDPYLDELRHDVLAGKRTLAGAAWKAVFLAGDWVTEEGASGITPVQRRPVRRRPSVAVRRRRLR